jgi:hypothetical protein
MGLVNDSSARVSASYRHHPDMHKQFPPSSSGSRSSASPSRPMVQTASLFSGLIQSIISTCSSNACANPHSASAQGVLELAYHRGFVVRRPTPPPATTHCFKRGARTNPTGSSAAGAGVVVAFACSSWRSVDFRLSYTVPLGLAIRRAVPRMSVPKHARGWEARKVVRIN